VGDFNWSMRAGLVANTVHVAETWGGWRIHSTQATAGAKLGSTDHRQKIDAMIDDALRACSPHLNPAVYRHVMSAWRQEGEQLRAYMRQLAEYKTRTRRNWFAARRLLTGSRAARAHVRLRLQGHCIEQWVAESLQSIGFGPMLVPATTTGSTDILVDSLQTI
jgi:hypothetical protein